MVAMKTLAGAIKALVLLVLLLAPAQARAEIALANSLEWLCAAADRVLLGRITSVQAVDPAMNGAAGKGRPAQGKDEGLVLYTVQVSQTLKGADPQATRCVGQRGVPAAELARLAAAGAPLLFFLTETIQATSYQGRTCNLWPLAAGDDRPALIPLAAPGKRLLRASDFQVQAGGEPLLAAVRQTLARLPPRKPLEEPARGLLAVPFSSPVHAALYGGSTVYLYVPRALFPQARESLR